MIFIVDLNQWFKSFDLNRTNPARNPCDCVYQLISAVRTFSHLLLTLFNISICIRELVSSSRISWFYYLILCFSISCIAFEMLVKCFSSLCIIIYFYLLLFLKYHFY